jgi:integrase
MFSHDDNLLAAYAGFLERTNRACGTRAIYVAAATGLIEAFPDRSVTGLSSIELDGYLSNWRSLFVAARGRPPRPATYRNRIEALRAFYAWLDRFGLLRDPEGRPCANPMRLIEPPRVFQRRNDWLTPDEDRSLLDAPRTETERIIIWLLRWTGVRCGEAVSLRRADLNLAAGEETITIRVSKTESGKRRIPIVPELLPQLQVWLAELERRELTQSAAPLLTSRAGRPLSAAYVWRVVKQVALHAGVRPTPCTCAKPDQPRHQRGCPRSISGENCSTISPHTLRRTFGSDLLNRGLRLEVVSKLLGHANTTVTQLAYAELLDLTVRTELLACLTNTTNLKERA